ncbi:DUF1176 domain-containing protein [Serratia sp. S1B]|nr:DUF1176 domain-containing protein [Serratia sp. S1B]
MNNKKIAAIILAGSFVSSAMAQDEGVAFEHKNWELVCDNTHTCRAAGYSDGPDSTGSVLITRLAGPGTQPTGAVRLQDIIKDNDSSLAPKLTLWINDKSMGSLQPTKEGIWHLSTSQTLAVLKTVNGSGKVEFKDGPVSFVLSGDGATAVLLKMDDVQGRIGTPGALTKKGDKPESSVPAAIPAPVIQWVKVSAAPERPLTAPEITALKPKLLAILKSNDCQYLQSYLEDSSHLRKSANYEDFITLTPLGNDHALISALCWPSPYGDRFGYWVIDNALKTAPVSSVTHSASRYNQGEISMMRAERNGDCYITARWLWDGETFRKSSEATTGMCRFIHAGGTWYLPTFVTEVKPAKGQHD